MLASSAATARNVLVTAFGRTQPTGRLAKAPSVQNTRRMDLMAFVRSRTMNLDVTALFKLDDKWR